MAKRVSCWLITVCLLLSTLHAQTASTYHVPWSVVDGRPVVLQENLSSEDTDSLPAFFFDSREYAPMEVPQLIVLESETVQASEAHIPQSWYADATNRYAIRRASGTNSWRVTPIRINRETGMLERLVAFSLEYEHGAVVRGKRPSPSPLSQGRWFKVAVFQSGLYKIDTDLLEQAGWNPGQLDPSQLLVYGSGGSMLSKRDDRPDGYLRRLPVQRLGLEDGRFSDDDALVFYAEGPGHWRYDASNALYRYQKNLFSDTAFYYVSYQSGASPQGLSTAAFNDDPNASYFETYRYRDQHEQDRLSQVNKTVKSGKDWVGEDFTSQSERNFSFTIPNRDESAPIALLARTLAQGPGPSRFIIDVNGQRDPIDMPATSGSYTDVAAKYQRHYARYQTPGNALRVTLSYNRPGTEWNAWLDFITINTQARLVWTSDQPLDFRVPESATGGATVQYGIQAATDALQVWEVTHPNRPVARQAIRRNGRWLVSAPGDSVREFVAFTQDQIKTPAWAGSLPNQDLRSTPGAQLMIIAHPEFMEYAQELARFREEQDGLTTRIVTPRAIFNEFSCGRQDPMAIRNYLRYLHRSYSPGDPAHPEYLLLFGDASYDYKDRITGNTNYVPTFQTDNITSPTNSYCSDDLYGLLGDGEVFAWLNNGDGFDLDLGIGRFPVNNGSQARALLDKIKRYKDVRAQGSWRNTLTFMADDEDNNTHLRQVEQVQSIAAQEGPAYNIEKIYFDAFEQKSVSSGQRYPGVTRRLNERIQEGALIINYMGHGGELGLAHERVLSKETIDGWNNAYRMPLFVTATCEFSRFDDPEFVAAGEEVLFKEGGGGIALLTTTRLVYTFGNQVLNTHFQREVFRRNEDGVMPRLGDVIRRTKNGAYRNASTTNTKNFSLLGDPSLRLAYPERRVRTRSMNSIPVEEPADGIPVDSLPAVDTAGALEIHEITAEVLGPDGQRDISFQGEVEVVVFDKPYQQTTLVNDPKSAKATFQVRNNIVFRGRARVRDGQFTVTFITPRDLSFEPGRGKVSYYCQSDDNIDGHGYFNQFLVGGAGNGVGNNFQPPEISLYMQDRSFEKGDEVGRNPLLIAELDDDYGINVSSAGIGHDITAQLDDRDPIVMNRFYIGKLDDYTSGVVEYRFSELEPGLHRLRFQAWDVHNNPASAETEFVVAQDPGLAIETLLNAPNPFRGRTSIALEHNQPGTQFEIQISVFDLHGQLIDQVSYDRYSPGSRIEDLNWSAQRVREGGMYLYRLELRSENGEVAGATERMVIIR